MNVARIAKRIDEAYEEWEQGGSSPSAHDLALYGAEVMGVMGPSLAAQQVESIGDEVFEAQCNGASVMDIAGLIHTRLSEAVLERQA